jgi:hypothetical protein
MIRGMHLNINLNSKSMTKYGYELLNNVYTLKVPIKNSKDKVKLSIKVDNINDNFVENIEAEIDTESNT